MFFSNFFHGRMVFSLPTRREDLLPTGYNDVEVIVPMYTSTDGEYQCVFPYREEGLFLSVCCGIWHAICPVTGQMVAPSTHEGTNVPVTTVGISHKVYNAKRDAIEKRLRAWQQQCRNRYNELCIISAQRPLTVAEEAEERVLLIAEHEWDAR